MYDVLLELCSVFFAESENICGEDRDDRTPNNNISI